ncbi:16S rRNA (adenine(1518)-N(6)/adenine(1519)-N(6))-dimethyltransferase RsmA [Paramaledivibacter caminithermalis]|jgi:16S rRNA (adenine1518-N6/adenine1519-N6)-dimethyltransferase|uniref:Ribosomal RNA small subunit methyltransferase A n=1 Tax=Paramaledivibacter caminithermalis (strain DSM 15212 / CIP 107654 / DViRD3) TaxID=1121301 RepID=A0A1M6TTU9_PARC5|nr:16S rRNA (adenine(1518)-N(6)/adenine(1519)-N(6))-dimethyltransferase RsmA [Paramaledivibacter caminithermalis]SHK60346.1 dimethyladenosine transferase [Paramaledivibacter caminithermalis DSM 15212]
MEKLSSPKITKEIVNKYGFKFSKSLGQNFLIDENIIYKIIEGSQITKEDIIVEVGPGIGTLTQYLADKAEKVLAIEIDKSLIPILEETLKDYENVEVINSDVLDLDLKGLIENKFPDRKVKVVANLPYYVTTPIIMKFLEEEVPVKDIVVMVQKEVADRLKAKPKTKDYGSLSVAVQYYCEPEIITRVPKSVFIPNPNVESTVIRLKVLENPKVNVKDKKVFLNVVRASFAKRRKTLLNSLSFSDFELSKDEIKKILKASNIDSNRRGESLTIQEFAILSNNISSIL